MKKVTLAICLTLLISSVCLADQIVSVTVPDSFSSEDKAYVQELANVAIQRILEKPLVPAEEAVELVKTEVDRLRVANGLDAKFAVEEVIK